jgi:hypothetical protein
MGSASYVARPLIGFQHLASFSPYLPPHGLELIENSAFNHNHVSSIHFDNGVLTQNSNTMELIKFLEEKKRLQFQIRVVSLKIIPHRTMSKKKN